jgi:serine/threonine protein kinase
MVVGRLLGKRYQILEKIGCGGMAIVYRAKDIFLNRIVALKVLREQFAGDEEFVKRFRHEAQAVASLSHDNIVSIYDVGHENDIYYLVMELVRGRDLKEIIKEKAPFSAEDTVYITTQICDALTHAHQQKIIHRDIKPHNIIITDAGRVKVTDFGLARAVTTATVTHTGNIMGSVHYFSPEQARGEIADEKSDLYSLGVVLYEMVTGKVPFQGDSPISVAVSKIQNEPIPPREHNPEIGAALEKVILRAMAKNPKRRYQSAEMLKQNLLAAIRENRLLDQEEVEVTEKTIVLPPVRKTKKKRFQLSEIAEPFKLWTWMMVVLLIVGFLLGMYLSTTVLAKSEVIVPDLTEKTLAEAERELTSRGLILKMGKKVNHPTIEADLIITQVPKPKEVVKKNIEVEVTLSKGPLMVEVPTVVNKSLTAAEVELANYGLLSDPFYVYHNQIAEDYVIRQEPAPGQNIAQESLIKLIVSKGPAPTWIKMPQLVGYNLTEAKEIIQSNGLTLGVLDPETSYRYPAETVLRQDPGADSEVLQGTIVNLVISAGPGPQ